MSARKLVDGMVGEFTSIVQQAESAIARSKPAPATSPAPRAYFIVGSMPEGSTGARLVIYDAPPMVRERHANVPRSLAFPGSSFAFPLARGVAQEFRSPYIANGARVVCRKVNDPCIVDELRAIDDELRALNKRIDQLRDDRQALMTAAVPGCELVRERDCAPRVKP